ncbi:hypothetical protein [Breznakiella homolactica]|uniref:Uncharacterized protein n=1 Tax=Breznakiella homolactica TaxID=2798577 RepID=A0A7T7XL06_9SPIR|nr:hypothetical protein [Breznakiella homolactica]QQO08355.1 hypothetical protein JFL75_15660 [Breznakiella homolactica]
MKNIIKYQLKSRRQAMLLTIGIITVLHAVVWILEGIEILKGGHELTSSLVFWIALCSGIMFIIMVIQFIFCSSGHVSDLLYKDTSYLMLTIPRRGWQVLGGRFVAGLLEYLIYAASIIVLSAIHGIIGLILVSATPALFWKFLGYMVRELFILNFDTVLWVAFILVFMFIVTGIIINFVSVLSRSIVRRKSASVAIATVGFFFIIHWTFRLGVFISRHLGWYGRLFFKMGEHFNPPIDPSERIINFPIVKEFFIPVAPFILYLIIAALLFWASSWLFEKKVEV